MRIFKRALWVVVGLFGLVGVALAVIYIMSSRRMSRSYDVTPAAVSLSSDSTTLAYGQHVAQIRGCVDCHARDLSGSLFFDAMPVAKLTASNLTPGRNGAGAVYSDADWVRSIRHGVGPDGKPLLLMPSHEYHAMGPKDLGAVISWIKSVPPVDTDHPPQQVGVVGRALFLAGQVPLLPAELIHHADSNFTQPEAGVSVEYGRYLATSCIGCHGEGYSGGKMPGVPPDWPVPANLTPDASGLATWTEEQFNTFLTTGARPDGRFVDAQYMPWPLGAAMTDEERSALWIFLRSLPATPHGNR